MDILQQLIDEVRDLRRQLQATQRLDTGDATALRATANTWTANNTFNSAATTGSALSSTRNLTATSTDSPVVSILQDHASDDQSALLVSQDGTGAAVEVRGPNAKSSATVSTPLTMYSNDSAATALALLYQINGSATAGSRYTSIHSVEQGTGYRALVLNPNADVLAVILRAFSAAGLTITDDGGNTAIFVEDGGRVGIGTSTPVATEAFSRLTVQSADNTAHIQAIINTGTGQNGLAINRTGGTASRWVMYIPAAENALAIYSGTLAANVLKLLSTGRVEMIVGSSGNDAAVGGVLYIDSGSSANGTTLETTLATYTVPANTLSTNNMSLSISAWGTITNAVATKTLKFYFGATVVTLISGGSGIPATWTMHARVIRTGATTQDILVEAVGTGLTAVTITTAAETLSGTVVVKMTGQGGAGSQVLQEGYVVEFLDQNT